ncbi:hypothetical protein D3C87_1669790 [compost metagenome]
MTVPISTVNMTGLRTITLGSSLIKDCFNAVCTKAGSNNLLEVFIILFYLSIVKYSASGPNASAGK